jgi:hypothetical protein
MAPGATLRLPRVFLHVLAQLSRVNFHIYIKID